MNNIINGIVIGDCSAGVIWAVKDLQAKYKIVPDFNKYFVHHVVRVISGTASLVIATAFDFALLIDTCLLLFGISLIAIELLIVRRLFAIAAAAQELVNSFIGCNVDNAEKDIK